MIKYLALSLGFFGLMAVAAYAAKDRPELSFFIAYEFLMGLGLCGVILGLALRDLRPPWGITEKLLIWLGIAPSLAQMFFAAHMPCMCWLSPLCLLALWYKAAHGKKEENPAQDPALHIPDKALRWIFMLLIPMCFWDWKQFPALYGLWALALKILQTA
jgi:hypothetical protein